MDLKTKADNYFDGLLSGKERKKFINEIKDNLEIREYLIQRELLEAKLSEYYSSKESLDKAVENDIKVYLSNYSSNNKREIDFKDILSRMSTREKKKLFINKTAILNFAAAVALLLIIGIGFSNRFIQNSKQKRYLKLYSQYFEPDKDFNTASLQALGIDSLTYSRYDSYSSIDLNNRFYNIVRSGVYDDKSLVYLSVLLIKNGDEELALSQLKEILEFANPPLSDLACWYFALANLKIAEIDITVENLNYLCTGNSEFKEKACELLKLIANK